MGRSRPLLVEIGEGLSIIVGQPTISSWTTKNRPKKPKTGTFGFNSQTASLEYWDGKNWFAAALTS